MSSKDMLGPLTRALVGVPAKMLGILLDIANRLSTDDSDPFFKDLAKFVRGWKKSILRRLFESEDLTLEASEGGDTIAGSTDLFEGPFNEQFVKWGLNTPSLPTDLTRVVVDELIVNATFAQMFTGDLERRRLTQGQIKQFCRKYCAKLFKDRDTMFFLFTRADEPVKKDCSNLFVAAVDVDGSNVFVAGVDGVGHNQLEICRNNSFSCEVDPFSCEIVWGNKYRLHVVSAQQTP